MKIRAHLISPTGENELVELEVSPEVRELEYSIPHDT